MFDKEAIAALQEGDAIDNARAAVENAMEADTGVVALPSDYQVHDLEPYMQLRRRARGVMRTQSLPAFVQYARAHAEKGAAVFVNQHDMSATAVLNLGTPSDPGHADNRAVFDSVPTAAYKALNQHTERALSQKACAEFLEDWADHVQCFDADGAAYPSARAVAAVRKLTIESLQRLESEQQSLSAARSTFESVAAKSKEPLPQLLYFSCKPYADLDERLFVLRFGVQTGGDKPTLVLRIKQMELHQEEMAQELAERVREAFADGQMPVLLGGYTAAK